MANINGPNIPVSVGDVSYVWVQDEVGNAPARMSIGAFAAQVAGNEGPTYATRAQLFADLDWDAGVRAYVVGDPTVAFNGIYKKNGAPGTGSWTRLGPLPGPQTVIADDKSITVSSGVAARKHSMRRSLGSTDCPVSEANIAGKADANATIIRQALWDFGYLDAGPFGAAYELSAVTLDGANSPVASIEGNGSQEFHALFADYNNDLPNNPYGTSASMFRYNAGAVVGDATSGVTINGTAGASWMAGAGFGGKLRLHGFKIIGHHHDATFVNPIVARGLDEVSIEDLDISGFALGYCIDVSMVRNGGRIRGNRLHGFTSNDTTINDSRAVMGGIIVDENKASNTTADVAWTEELQILDNHCHDFTVGAAQLAQRGKLAYGINVLQQARKISCRGNHIWNVGRGISASFRHGSVLGNLIDDVEFGIRCLDGFSWGAVIGNVIKDADLFGIQFSGSASASHRTLSNIVSGNIVELVNAANAGVTAACFHVASGSPVGNVSQLYVKHNYFRPFGNAYTILSQAGNADRIHFDGNEEVVDGNGIAALIQGAPADSWRRKGGDACSSMFMAYLVSDIVNATGNGTTVTITGFSETVDRNLEFVPSTGIFTCKNAGEYEFSGKVTFTNLDNAVNSIIVFLNVNNGTTNEVHQAGDVGVVPAEFLTVPFIDKVSLAVGDTVKLQAQVAGTTHTVGIRGISETTGIGIAGPNFHTRFTGMRI